jgi:hypothetical protein
MSDSCNKRAPTSSSLTSAKVPHLLPTIEGRGVGAKLAAFEFANLPE